MKPTLDIASTQPAEGVSAKVPPADKRWLESYLVKGQKKPSLSQVAAWAIGMGRDYVRVLEREDFYARIRQIADDEGLAVWRVVSDAVAHGLVHLERERGKKPPAR
jgi:hypothetical protein